MIFLEVINDDGIRTQIGKVGESISAIRGCRVNNLARRKQLRLSGNSLEENSYDVCEERVSLDLVFWNDEAADEFVGV